MRKAQRGQLWGGGRESWGCGTVWLRFVFKVGKTRPALCSGRTSAQAKAQVTAQGNVRVEGRGRPKSQPRTEGRETGTGDNQLGRARRPQHQRPNLGAAAAQRCRVPGPDTPVPPHQHGPLPRQPHLKIRVKKKRGVIGSPQKCLKWPFLASKSQQDSLISTSYVPGTEFMVLLSHSSS